MRDLADVYAEARFGKAAAIPVVTPDEPPADPKGVKAYLTMPQLDEETLAIRNAIEASVRKEQQLKEKAKALTEFGRYRLSEAPKAGITGQLSDILRAAIPGLSPAASAEVIEKTGGLFGYTTPKAEEKYDLMHALAAGGGAGLGALAQRGALTEAGGQGALRSLLSRASGGMEDPEKWRAAAPKVTKEMGRALTLKSAPARLKALLLGKKPRMGKAVSALKPGTIMGALKSFFSRKMPFAGRSVNTQGAKKILEMAKGRGVGLGGWKGALAGAALVTLPFAIRRWFINRAMRERGGGAAAEAATTAEANIAAAEKLKDWRKQQLAQLETAVGPGAPAWTPPDAPAAPGPAPAPTPTPGPFSQYELVPFQR